MELCKRANIDHKDILSRTYAAKAIGWRRGFKSKSPRWENKSVATLYQTNENSEVLGTVVLLKPEEISKLDVLTLSFT